ncbi:hypothetical protein OG799_18315 [Micromonospora sp. NBC_00898]|uniref:DUF6933 domain-containing protein n=1 Tax=Micromonospora sp. NBC_00898 TaxID=2975981 RepID=UPI00386A9567|nr:hypothetical protein OG799_18315 [Micromonospora sp. NBC_00898]
MLIVRATRKLLARIGPADLDGEESTTLLGQWYATLLPWRPQTALLVNELTLLPVLMPLAPAATLLDRIGDHIATALATHQASNTVIDNERRQMNEHRVAGTVNRSVVGIMNEFSYLATVYRSDDTGQSLLDLSLRLATTPCSPLYRKNISPDRELAALLNSAA